jgi:hypothetical protein
MEHFLLMELMEKMTLLELALWKAKLDEKGEVEDNFSSDADVQAKKACICVEIARKQRRITSGASIVIKNVLPFFRLG